MRALKDDAPKKFCYPSMVAGVVESCLRRLPTFEGFGEARWEGFFTDVRLDAKAVVEGAANQDPEKAARHKAKIPGKLWTSSALMLSEKL